MDLPVLIEPIAENVFRARLGDPLGLTAEGASKEEALDKLRLLVTQRVANGTELTVLRIPQSANGSGCFEGIYREDDPMVQEWLRTIEENRRLDDIAEGIER